MDKKRRVSIAAAPSFNSSEEDGENELLKSIERSIPNRPKSKSLKTASSLPTIREAEFDTASPYERRILKRRYKKIYPNRVYATWYRRYVNKLPDDDGLDFQPFDEVQKVDEDIALQYFYGEDVHMMGSSTDKFILEKRKMALQKYRRIQEQEDQEKASEMIDAGYTGYKSMTRSVKAREIEFGATAGQMKIYSPIVEFLQKLHLGKKRQLQKILLKPDSKWHTLKRPNITQKLRAMYKKLIQEEIYAHFRKVIRLVVAVIRFIETIRFLSGDTKQILRELEHFKAMQNQDSKKTVLLGRKKIFNVQKYCITKELLIPFDTKMTLTKPWFTRHDSEIDSVIDVLQSYKSFVQYPPAFQRRLATLAWLIETQGDKYIIRERHLACDFYVLLKGKAKIMKLFGDPYIRGTGDLKCIRYIKKSEGFGDECMSDPECEREYSVISCEPCSLLSINVHDYLQMLSTRKEDEFAPEHIIFLSNLKFMENFPKKKLLEEGNENLTVHYFRAETAISKNISEANYVFVVLNGSCQMLSEISPDLIIQDGQRSGASMGSKKYMPSATQFSHKKSQLKVSLPPINWMKQQIETQKRLLEPMCAMTTASIAVFREKSNKIIKSLPKAQRATLQSLNEPIPESQQDSFTKSMNASMDNYFQKLKSATCIANIVNTEQVTSETPSPSSSRKNTITDTFESMVKSDTGSHLSPFPRANETTFDVSLESSSAGSVRDKQHRKSPIVRERSTVPYFYSRWRFVRKLSRGDYVGQEWLDYNDGPFEPPEDIMSLVSDGCEMILVKKSFLLKYLRREW